MVAHVGVMWYLGECQFDSVAGERGQYHDHFVDELRSIHCFVAIFRFEGVESVLALSVICSWISRLHPVIDSEIELSVL